MNKKISIGATVALIIISIALTISVTMVVAMRVFNSSLNDLNKRQVMYSYIEKVDGAVRQNYFGSIDEETLRAALAQGYMDGIEDPHAAYLSATQYKAQMKTNAGQSTGFGLEIMESTNGQIVVSAVHKNSAADRAGLQKGDVIASTDGAQEKESLASIRQKLNTAEKILVSFTRGNETKAVNLSANDFTLVSAEGRMIDTFAYIRIRAFHDNTMEQFKKVYTSLEAENPSGYIFDLRDNTGGSVEAAKEMIAYLMPRGTFATLTDKDQKTRNLSAEDTYQMEAPSVTLVNSRTEGEAELFAGVLQEFGKTTVIGVKTAGRSLVQAYYPISTDGSAVKLSVSALSLVRGGAWEGTGIKPDKIVSLPSDKEARLLLLSDAEDSQLQAAIAALQGGTANTTGTTAATTAETTVQTNESSTSSAPSGITTASK